MIVPQFWAEGRIQQIVDGRQLTVRRFGWSDDSPIAAQAHADERTREAFARIAAGEALQRRERKQAYNGANGMPIREEIIERHGEDIVTRNGYGARCLNTPDVMFVDIDVDPDSFHEPTQRPHVNGAIVIAAAVIAAVVMGAFLGAWWGGLLAALVVLTLGFQRRLFKPPEVTAPKVDPLAAARARIDRFIEQHPQWHLRLYRTPSGLRVLAMHDVFAPSDPAAVDAFLSLGADEVYARMCRNQHCFRARLTAKPWRIGIEDHIRPRRGVWPVSPEKFEMRQAWVAHYEHVASNYAACTFMESLGDLLQVHPRALEVQVLHDALSRADSGLPIA